MKNNLFILGAFLCTALFVTSCTDDNKDDDENEGKASIIVGINMQPQADMGYIVPIQDMKAGTMSFANAVETKITPYLMSYRDWVFYVPGTSEGTIVKYSRQDDGTLKVEGRLEVATAAPMCASIAFVSATKAYASAPNDNKIIIFNPTTMVKTGEINVARPEYGLDGSSTPNPLGLILRDGKLYVGCGEFDQMPIAERAEAAYERKMYRYKAQYSLDCENGIENAVLLKPQTPEMLLEEKQLQEQVYAAVMKLPEKQAKRIYVRYYLGMTVNEIAEVEGVDPSRVRDSIRRGLKQLGKYF